MTLPRRIVFASNNSAKTVDVAKFFKLYGIELVNYRELMPEQAFPPETTDDQALNARIKAQFIHDFLPTEYVLADDSGMFLRAFPERFGLTTAREFKALGLATVVAENQYVQDLYGADDDRSAYLAAIFVLITPDQDILTVEGHGGVAISPENRGQFGKGLDTIFLTETGKTIAELTTAEQLNYHHRGRATKRLLAKLQGQDIIWQANGHDLTQEVGIIYGVLNVSPESFYNGEHVGGVAISLAQAVQQLADGADVIEVGGQTTRPGFVPLTPEAEIERIVPVIQGIKKAHPYAVVAVDTYKYEVMVAAIEAGADIINDVNGFTDDPRKLSLMATTTAGLLTMFNPRDHELSADIAVDMMAWFTENLASLEAAGIQRERIALDPGVGYSKNSDVYQDLAMMRAVGDLKSFNRPIMTAVSNKGWAKFLFELPKDERADLSLVAATEMYRLGAKVLRVHDVKSARQMTSFVELLKNAR
ncbi:dihydropteroate synthase [Pseudolactococcus reticulitermitis]|uniref:Dihydropteroate synthase n=1 Tax=Pseudolactococcus reticulitermitis TaxID=2025039 RepID=A0A224XFU8_9LACT|nr:dihydropteroate synthase [Lactococcus reticulitermitis]GAX48413.1 dihydropteroate synthase [Lactococcus reticulitermitis]